MSTDTSAGIERIAAERQRQIILKGYTPEHDAEHDDGSIVGAAREYLKVVDYQSRYPDQEVDDTFLDITDLHGYPTSSWRWSRGCFRPESRIRNLEKAGALIAAEIDRLIALGVDDG